MNKILLILTITFVSLVDAQEIKKPYVIERIKVEGTYMWVICVQNYVFITNLNESLTQLMRDGSKGKTLVPMQPMRCEDYKKTS
jgi:hypothetical protein